MKDLGTRAQIKALYDAGEDAVITLVESLLEKITHLEKVVESQEKRIMALEEQLKKNSRNSDKPPSSDGLKRQIKSSRPTSTRKNGGQKGHDGHTLKMVANPDHIYKHQVKECVFCHCSLQDSKVIEYKKRQLFDIPPLKIEVSEHQAEVKKCSGCGIINTADFPVEISHPVQYGNRIKSLVVYLMQYQLLPSERTTEVIEDIFSHPISEGTLYNWNRAAYQALEKTEAEIKQQIIESPINHFDETGTFCENKLNWLHVTSNPKLTYYAIHPKRGKLAMDEINILPQYQGKAVHDFWNSYLKYHCKHVICNAHLIRELTALSETLDQKWSSQIIELLLTIKKRTEQNPLVDKTLDQLTLRKFEDQYEELVSKGLRLNPIQNKSNHLSGSQTGKRGRPKQSKATNLLIRLRDYRSEVLAFMYDFRVPFTNNLAERDLRMAKVKQKISGTFRSREGAWIFCRIRGVISTVKKNNLNVLNAISQAFLGSPPSFCLND
jgi:transposase